MATEPRGTFKWDTATLVFSSLEQVDVQRRFSPSCCSFSLLVKFRSKAISLTKLMMLIFASLAEKQNE